LPQASTAPFAAEGRADDDADREVDDAALHGELAEFLQHPQTFLLDAAHRTVQRCRQA
jgi:hypothetical protein